MSEHVEGTNGTGAEPLQTNPAEAPRRKRAARSRSPSISRPAFIVLQMHDENGTPIHFDKRRIKILAVERDPDKVLQMVDSGEIADAFYLRIMLPPGSRAGSPNRPKTD